MFIFLFQMRNPTQSTNLSSKPSSPDLQSVSSVHRRAPLPQKQHGQKMDSNYPAPRGKWKPYNHKIKKYGGIPYTAHEAQIPPPLFFDLLFIFVYMLILGQVRFAPQGQERGLVRASQGQIRSRARMGQNQRGVICALIAQHGRVQEIHLKIQNQVDLIYL